MSLRKVLGKKIAFLDEDTTGAKVQGDREEKSENAGVGRGLEKLVSLDPGGLAPHFRLKREKKRP